jgi:hypothetical protein
MFVVDVGLLPSIVLTASILSGWIFLFSFNSDGTIHWAKALVAFANIPRNLKTTINNIISANIGVISINIRYVVGQGGSNWKQTR